MQTFQKGFIIMYSFTFTYPFKLFNLKQQWKTSLYYLKQTSPSPTTVSLLWVPHPGLKTQQDRRPRYPDGPCRQTTC